MRRAQTTSTLGLLLVSAWASVPAWTQVIPNPLMRPQRTQPSAPAATTPDPQARGATAPPAGRASRAIDGEGLPAEAEPPKPLSEQLANLYVSAVIGDRAVLRSLEVRTVPRLGASSVTGGNASSGTRSGEPTGGGGGGGGGVGNDIAGLRTQVYVVRNGEVLPFLDRTRLLVRVRDTTVTLFDVTDIPPGNYDPLDLMDRGFPVAFRGSVDSVQTLPPTAPALTGPGEGLDGNAFRNSRDTQRGIGSSNNNNSNSGSGNSGSNTGNDNNNP
jgi:uncharacterized membrane protein YgcG